MKLVLESCILEATEERDLDPYNLVRGGRWVGRVPDEGDVHAEAAVDGGAVEAEEDAVGDGCPGGILGAAVEAHLHMAIEVLE